MAAACETLRLEVGRAAQLGDALRDLVGMLLLVVGVLEELRRHALGVDALRHEVMALGAPRADDLGGERLVEELEDHAAVGVVPGSHRALRDVLPGPLAQRLDVGEERSRHRQRFGFSGALWPVAAERSLVSARFSAVPLARSRSTFACFWHASLASPFWSSHFCFATS